MKQGIRMYTGLKGEQAQSGKEDLQGGCQDRVSSGLTRGSRGSGY